MKKNGRKTKKTNGKAKTQMAVPTTKAKTKKEKTDKKNGKEKVLTVKFKRADKAFKIETKNANWNEIKSLTKDLLETIKSLIWDIADTDKDIEALSEFLVIQILYNCVDSDILKKVPGFYDTVCNMAERYPVVFNIE